jgi:phospholipase C
MATIEHVIVLMLENRSFDCMLGALYPAGPNFNGLTGLESNPYNNATLGVWRASAMDSGVAVIPDPDPGEKFVDMNEQLFGPGRGRTADRPSMSGFVQNYMSQPAADKPYDPAGVMHYFAPEQVPVISTLARAFGVCDQWHASAPCQTWPNRFFVHTATALGYVNNNMFPVPFPAHSIFARLSANRRSWRIYYHDVPQSLALRDVLARSLLHRFGQFLADAHCGALPDYSFIEPRYFSDFRLGVPSDQHPPHDVSVGETLIAAVYNAVRSSPCWPKSLLVITYDEHGGCYDHAPPPVAISPDGRGSFGFTFDRYGVRVPAVIVSPWVPPGSIVRAAPAGLAFNALPYPFDHTSIIATLRKLFNLGTALTARDNVAPDLLSALSLPTPSNDGPRAIHAAAALASTAALRKLTSRPLNDHQDALARMARMLPPQPLAPGAPIPEGGPLAPSSFDNVITAGLDGVGRVKSFLGI